MSTPPSIERQISQIGEIAVSSTPKSTDEIFIYCEVEDGVISANIFITTGGKVKYKVANRNLQDAIYNFWGNWKIVENNKEWRVMIYIIKGIEFDMKLIYPDQIDKNLDHMGRRKKYAESRFELVEIDYSNPR